MNILSQVVFFAILSILHGLPQKNEDEGRPYEFGFTIDGQQHRHEKKDEKGIIQGEFGFITADGIYHVTVYATDENGKFKILSMRNLRISAPLDGSPFKGEISPEANKYRKQANLPPLPQAAPNPLSIADAAPPHQVITTPKSEGPTKFTLLPTVKPACASCGYITTTKKPPPSAAVPSQVYQSTNQPGGFGVLKSHQRPGAVLFGSDGGQQNEPNTPGRPQFPSNRPQYQSASGPQNTNYNTVGGPQGIQQSQTSLGEGNPNQGQNTLYPQDTPGAQQIQPAPVEGSQNQGQNTVYPQHTPGAQQIQPTSVEGSQNQGQNTLYPINIPGAQQSGPVGDSQNQRQDTLYPQNTSGVQPIQPSSGVGIQHQVQNPFGEPQSAQHYPPSPGGNNQNTQNIQDTINDKLIDTQYISGGGSGGNIAGSSPFGAPGTNRNPQVQGAPEPNPLQLPGQGPESVLSTLPPISVSDNVIHVGGDRKQDIPIKDKFPGMKDGLPDGIEEKDITNLLYKFHYTVGFHGHYEKGLKNGAKIGGYFVNGRDGISRVVTYIADENGYRPKVKFINLGLDSDDTPKPETEKTFGLKSFEFVWYPV